MTHTTAAIQTPPGAGGIAVITLVGAEAESILSAIFQPLPTHTALPGNLQLGRILRDGQIIDQAVIARTSGAIEINLHGGPAVVKTVMTLLADRGAEPTAPDAQGPTALPVCHPQWNNPAIGRDLLAAMPLARSARVVALLANQWSAGISQLARTTIDPPSPQASTDLRHAARRFAAVQKLLTGPQVVLVGPPNVGKSTLANLLVARAVSLVHHQPGTTRDWVSEPALLHGLPIQLTDTAGLWDTPATDVDAQAVDRARHRATEADLAVLLSDHPIPTPDFLTDKPLLTVATKTDLPGDHTWAAQAVSARAGSGIDALAHAILGKLGLADLDESAPAAFTARQTNLLAQAADALDCSDALAVRALKELLEGSAPPA